MSASTPLGARPWAVAHRTLLVLGGLVIALALALAVAVPLLVLRGGSTAAPAHAPAPAVERSVPLQPAPPPCTIQTVGRPHPC